MFDGDVEDNLKHVDLVASTLTYYIELFDFFKTRLETYFKHPSESNAWNFDDELVLGRIIKFCKRLEEIKVKLFLSFFYLI